MSSFARRAGTALVLMAFTPFFGDNVKTFLYCIVTAIVGQVSLAGDKPGLPKHPSECAKG